MKSVGSLNTLYSQPQSERSAGTHLVRGSPPPLPTAGRPPSKVKGVGVIIAGLVIGLVGLLITLPGGPSMLPSILLMVSGIVTPIGLFIFCKNDVKTGMVRAGAILALLCFVTASFSIYYFIQMQTKINDAYQVIDEAGSTPSEQEKVSVKNHFSGGMTYLVLAIILFLASALLLITGVSLGSASSGKPKKWIPVVAIVLTIVTIVTFIPFTMDFRDGISSEVEAMFESNSRTELEDHYNKGIQYINSYIQMYRIISFIMISAFIVSVIDIVSAKRHLRSQTSAHFGRTTPHLAPSPVPPDRFAPSPETPSSPSFAQMGAPHAQSGRKDVEWYAPPSPSSPAGPWGQPEEYGGMRGPEGYPSGYEVPPYGIGQECPSDRYPIGHGEKRYVPGREEVQGMAYRSEGQERHPPAPDDRTYLSSYHPEYEEGTPYPQTGKETSPLGFRSRRAEYTPERAHHPHPHRKRPPYPPSYPPPGHTQPRRTDLCPRCSTPLRWVRRYQGWYCDRCERYI